MKIRVHEAAAREWREAVAFYEEKRSGLGRRFDNAFRTAMGYLSDFPYGAPKVRGQIRRKKITGWPYSILYQVLHDEILVAAVMHERRQPDYWTDR